MARDITNPALQAVPSHRIERRQKSPFKMWGTLLGTVAVAITVITALASFLKPSILAYYDVETKHEASEEHKRLEETFIQKLDDLKDNLPRRVAEEVRRKR